MNRPIPVIKPSGPRRAALAGLALLCLGTAPPLLHAQLGAAGDQGGAVQPADQGGPQQQGDLQQTGDMQQAEDFGEEGDLPAQDFIEPRELGDINIRVPLTLTNLHADVTGWKLNCRVARQKRQLPNRSLGWGAAEGEVTDGEFSGAVWVSFDMGGDHVPQDIGAYECSVRLLTEEDENWMKRWNWVSAVFRALRGSTTTPGRVVGVRENWSIQ